MIDDVFLKLPSLHSIAIKYIDESTIQYFYAECLPIKTCKTGCPKYHSLTNALNHNLFQHSLGDTHLPGIPEDLVAEKDLASFVAFNKISVPVQPLEQQIVDTVLLWDSDGENEWEHCNKWAGGCGFSANPAFWDAAMKLEQGVISGRLSIPIGASLDIIAQLVESLVHE